MAGKTIQEYYGLPKIQAVSELAEQYRYDLPDRVDCERAVGIEVELENYILTKAPSSAWIQKGDGSLRNNGVEYVTNPIEARLAPDMLYNLLHESLSKEVCFSPRTSIHVHVNVLDLTTEQVITAVMLYAAFESLFYKYTGRGRIKNIYCVPLMDTTLLTGINHSTINTVRQSWSKYSGLNLLPVAELGTLEFRHMHGTFDHRKVIIWVRLLTKLVEFARTQDTKEVRRQLLQFHRYTDYQQFLTRVFGDDTMYLKYESYADIASSINSMKKSFIQNMDLSLYGKELSRESAYFKASA